MEALIYLHQLMVSPLYIIYLDIDGVLNRAQVFYSEPGAPALHYEPRCVAELNRILEATGPEMVLSFPWRLEKDRDVSKLFRMCGGSAPNPHRVFLGKTRRTDYRHVGAEARGRRSGPQPLGPVLFWHE